MDAHNNINTKRGTGKQDGAHSLLCTNELVEIEDSHINDQLERTILGKKGTRKNPIWLLENSIVEVE